MHCENEREAHTWGLWEEEGVLVVWLGVGLGWSGKRHGCGHCGKVTWHGLKRQVNGRAGLVCFAQSLPLTHKITQRAARVEQMQVGCVCPQDLALDLGRRCGGGQREVLQHVVLLCAEQQVAKGVLAVILVQCCHGAACQPRDCWIVHDRVPPLFDIPECVRLGEPHTLKHQREVAYLQIRVSKCRKQV